MRLSGRQVFFLTGTDEHGQKVEQSAAKAGLAPQDFVDRVSTNFYDLLTTMNISNDAFVRTTSSDHQRAVQHLWQVLSDNGFIYKGQYSGWYSIRDECFYAESELVDGKAPTGADVEWVAKEESYFFKLSAFEDRLLQHYEDHPDFIAPHGRRNEVTSFVKGGLRDLSISRTSFRWGVPVPNDDDHIMYVWIDALTNYISAMGYPGNSDDGGNGGTKYDTFWPAALHVVGKDILRFHAVYWPAMRMAANLPLPKRLFAHGWWTKDGQKISKSIGNVIDPNELVQKYGVDQTRFFLMAEVNFGNDGDFSDKAMVYKVNANLANELGNLCQRTLSMVYKNCNQAVPVHGDFTDDDLQFLASAAALRELAAGAIAQQAIQKYVDIMVGMVVQANKYIDEQAPWVLRKTDFDRMQTVLFVIMEVLRHVAILYQPLIPDSAGKILDQLSVPIDCRTFDHLTTSHRIVPGTPIGQPVGIFPRIEVPDDALVQVRQR
jgi:methionyl-tRNA synthetase